ncbi:MAG: hypothetical protein HFI85_00410 [Clostridia bacterium]|jgi:hypothetical protein|nr:hypothetical protein [Clostridia bacterium]
MQYIENVKKEIRRYFDILEPEFPAWMEEYIQTKDMLKQAEISVTCGTIYSDLFESDFFFSSLDHSVAVALIVWHFTHDKKQTLSGLFHDIATPVFKHCVDFLNGDYMTQESTEDLTYSLLKGSAEIMNLLERDGIKLDEVADYHIYPIADNDTPQLSADRLEYSLSNALFTYKLANFKEIEQLYQDIEVQKNEDGIVELGFKTKALARKFVKITSRLSVIYREDRTRYSMQFLADLIKKLNEDGLITKQELYEKKEAEVIDIILNSKYAKKFLIWKNAKKVKTSSIAPKNVYYVHHGAKIRYIDPLFQGKRISKACAIAEKMIDKNLSFDMDKFVYLDFDF